MSDPKQPKDTPPSAEERRRMHVAERRWRKVYEPEVAEKLEVDRRYAIIRIGSSEFAFSNYDSYIAALHAAWAAGLVPDHGPSSVLGIDLPEVAPALRGVDVDPGSLASLLAESER